VQQSFGVELKPWLQTIFFPVHFLRHRATDLDYKFQLFACNLIATRTFSAVCPLTARCRIVCVSHLTPIRCHWHYLGTGPAPDSSRSRPAAPSSAYFAPDRVGSWDSIRRDGDGIHAGCWAIRSASAAPSGSRAMWLNQCPTSRPYCLQRRFSGSKSLAN